MAMPLGNRPFDIAIFQIMVFLNNRYGNQRFRRILLTLRKRPAFRYDGQSHPCADKAV